MSVFDNMNSPVSPDFCNTLMSNLKDRDIIDLLIKTIHKEKQQIRVIDTDSLIYILTPDLSIYWHPQFRDASPTAYCALGYGRFPLSKKLKARITAMTAYTTQKRSTNARDPWLHNHCFFPLGRLSQLRKSNASETTVSQHDMNYLVALNVSSNPKSLWLIYDYTVVDDANNYSNHKDSPNDALYHDPSCISEDAMYLDKLLDRNYEFDVGQICGNIQDWNASQGLTSQSVEKCLDATHYLMGNALHLKTKTPPHLKEPHDVSPGLESSPKLELSLGRKFQDEFSTFDHLIASMNQEAVDKKGNKRTVRGNKEVGGEIANKEPSMLMNKYLEWRDS